MSTAASERSDRAIAREVTRAAEVTVDKLEDATKEVRACARLHFVASFALCFLFGEIYHVFPHPFLFLCCPFCNVKDSGLEERECKVKAKA